jgi:DNA polymerase III alpha subunit
LVDASWYEHLVSLGGGLSPAVFSALARAGALRRLNVPRQRMAAEIAAFAALTDKELPWALQNWGSFASLEELLAAAARTKKEGGACHTSKRAAVLETELRLLRKPPYAHVDTAGWLCNQEEDLLGVALSATRTDAHDMGHVTTCKDFAAAPPGTYSLGVEVKQVREVKTKRGRSAGALMAFLTVEDGTGSLADVVVFPDVWKESASDLSRGVVVLQGEKDRNGSLIVQAVQAAGRKV